MKGIPFKYHPAKGISWRFFSVYNIYGGIHLFLTDGSSIKCVITQTFCFSFDFYESS